MAAGDPGTLPALPPEGLVNARLLGRLQCAYLRQKMQTIQLYNL